MNISSGSCGFKAQLALISLCDFYGLFTLQIYLELNGEGNLHKLRNNSMVCVKLPVQTVPR